MRKRMCVFILTAALALGMAGCGDPAGDAMESGQLQRGESGAEDGAEEAGNADEKRGAEDQESGIGGNQGAADKESGAEDGTGEAVTAGAGSREGGTDGNQGADSRESGTSGDQPVDNTAAGSPAADSDETQSTEKEGGREEMEEIEEIEIVQLPEWEPVEIPENDALAFVASMELGWCLGNTFDAANCNVSDELQYETAWSKAMTTKTMIHALAGSGIKTIRIPVSWHNHVDEAFRIGEAWMDRVQEVVDWAMEEGLYVILNIHHDNEEGFMYPSYEQLEQSKRYVSAIWEQIAARFASYDEKLIFETLNEPRHIGTDHEWWIDVDSQVGKECLDAVNQLNQAAVDAIRDNGEGYNATRYIMVPGYCASADFALSEGYILPTDSGSAENRILVSVHAYTPYNFALADPGDGSSTDQFSVAEQKGTADIDAFMGKLYDKFVSKGIGVVIGEFGARIKNNNAQARKEFAAYYVARARHYGMTACWWDNNAFAGSGENFGLFRRTDGMVVFPEILGQMVHYAQ